MIIFQVCPEDKKDALFFALLQLIHTFTEKKMLKMNLLAKISNIYTAIFSDRNIHRIERVVVYLALFGFLVHLLLIFLWDMGWINHPFFNQFSGSYISAIYTPFSFLLIFEVFLFLIYLPKSFTRSIGKQYEIISLIVLRRIFKDISHIDVGHLTENIFQNPELITDMVGVLALFLLIGIFYHLKKRQPQVDSCTDVHSFIAVKRLMSMILVPVLLGLAVYSFGNWIVEIAHHNPPYGHLQSDINHIFYDVFFSLLIYVDVFILIISFLYTHYYSQLIRNSGFIISTILIRLSFTASHLTNIILILVSVIFGVMILLLYNFFIGFDERKIEPVE